LRIVDAQVHDPAPVLPWQGDEESKLALTAELTLAAMDAIGVEAAVVAPGRHGPAFAEFAPARYPKRFARVIMCDRNRPNLDELVAGALSTAGVVAMRQVVVDYARNNADELRAGAFEPIFAAAERHGVPLFVLAPGFPAELAKVAEAHPGLMLIVDHLGLRQYPPLSMDADPWEKLPGLLALARYPNVAVKLCGAQLLSKEPYPHPDVWPYLHQVIEAFGANRLMWASDFTRLRMVPNGEPWAGLYSDSLNLVRDTPELSIKEKELLLGGTARRLLGWP
jgi:L-fuconolactonase